MAYKQKKAKSWRKSKLFGDTWTKNNSEVQIIRTAGSRWGVPTKTTYEVMINGKSKKRNLTKSQALSFAKDYMKK